MKKHRLLLTNLIIVLIITAGFIGITRINYQTYRVVVEDDIENITRLTCSNIYALIDNELTKPIFVAQTMANDTFLKSWLNRENDLKDDPKFKQEMKEYLLNYQLEYQYDAVYAISAKSGIYYYYDGVNKQVSPANEHDDWYFDFLESGQKYVLNIDTDEVNNNELTVFVDCRIEDSNGVLQGVTGVGLKMSRVQEMLAEFEQQYDLEAMLINAQGVVQADTDSDIIGKVSIFEDMDIANFREQILGNQNSPVVIWYPEGELDNCIISQYIKNLDWYLVIHKNTELLRKSFESMMVQDMVVVSFILLLLLSLSTLTIRRFDKAMHMALNTDTLTSLPNRREFERLFQIQRNESQYLFFFDIDRFKAINDTRGHLYGNQVLRKVAEITKAVVGDAGMVARWGGDEFVGVLKTPLAETEGIFADIKEQLADMQHGLDMKITISMGAVAIQRGNTLEHLMELADQELYTCKKSGGDGYRVHQL